MEEFTLLSPLLLTIGGLIIGAILKSLSSIVAFLIPSDYFLSDWQWEYVTVPVFSIFQKTFLHLLTLWQISIQNLILYLFLPVLIFDAAYELNLHIFKKTLANATLLAVPGLVICMLLTGLLLVGIGVCVPGFESWTGPLR